MYPTSKALSLKNAFTYSTASKPNLPAVSAKSRLSSFSPALPNSLLFSDHWASDILNVLAFFTFAAPFCRLSVQPDEGKQAAAAPSFRNVLRSMESLFYNHRS